TQTIVNRHRHQIDADRVVFAHQRSDFEFAADAIGGRNEYGMAIVAREQAGVVIEAEQTGETAEAIKDARRMRATQIRHHAGEGLLVHIEIQPCGLVVQRRLFHTGIIENPKSEARNPKEISKTKSKILTRCAGNPKSETRNPKEISKTKSKIENRAANGFNIGYSGLRFLSDFGFRISDFGFRISRAAGEDFPRSG